MLELGEYIKLYTLVKYASFQQSRYNPVTLSGLVWVCVWMRVWGGVCSLLPKGSLAQCVPV